MQIADAPKFTNHCARLRKLSVWPLRPPPLGHPCVSPRPGNMQGYAMASSGHGFLFLGCFVHVLGRASVPGHTEICSGAQVSTENLATSRASTVTCNMHAQYASSQASTSDPTVKQWCIYLTISKFGFELRMSNRPSTRNESLNSQTCFGIHTFCNISFYLLQAAEHKPGTHHFWTSGLYPLCTCDRPTSVSTLNSCRL